MPVFADHYRNSRQNRELSSSLPIAASSSAIPPSAIVIGGTLASSRPRIYPREYNNRNPKSPHPSSTTTPLLSAFQNPSEIFARSIPFPTFLSGSSPSSGGATGSLGSTSGGVGISGGPSSPPSAPASYSSAGGFSVPRQGRGYPGFEGQYSSSAGGGYYGSSQQQRYANGSPIVAHHNGAAHLQPGESSYACELATIDDLGVMGAGGWASASGTGGGGDNVVCLGWDGGVDVWRIGRTTVEQIGRLEGLKGGVKSAKILPNPAVNDPLAAHRPLICLTIHSQIPSAVGNVDDDHAPAILLESDSPYSTSPPSRPATSTSHRSSQSHQSDIAWDWQTTVEIWSLTTRTRVATLFTSPVIPTADIGFGMHGPPPVWGGLRVQVSANRVVVGVGKSGELYVFGIDTAKKDGQKPHAEWKCLEKLWTSIHYPNGHSFSSESTTSGAGMDGRANSFGLSTIGVPVFSLSDRWLAYCPASIGSFHAGGEVGVPTVSSCTSETPPPQPAISAAVSLEDEAFLNRMAREVTQEVIRGAKWAADAGFKKFQNYWHGGSQGNPSSPSHGNGMSGYAHSNGSMTNLQSGTHQQPSGLGQQIRQMNQMGTSPQHYYPPQAHAHEPRLVSIVGMSKAPFAGQHGSSAPMATFLPPAGVSYLSFAPGGLALLTASSKGDLLFVWDLLKVVHHPPQYSQIQHRSPTAPEPKPDRHVRQIARFTRITVATIVDVDWTSPRGEKIAVVTERGTAHFYDLPYGALQWPPLRRPPPSSSAVNNSQTTAAGAAVSNAVNLFNSSTQPLLTAARRRRSRSSSVGSPSGGAYTSPTSTRRSIAQDETPTGNNKISLPGLSSVHGIQQGCIKFLTAKERGYVAILGGNVLRIYELRPGGSGKKGSKAGGVASGNWFEYDLPLLPTGPQNDDGNPAGFWSLRPHHHPPEKGDASKYLAYAEIETNAMFIPWHQQRRVKMFTYTSPKGPVLVPKPVEDPVMSDPNLFSPNPFPAWGDIDSDPPPSPPPPRIETPPVSSGRKKKKGKLASASTSRSPAPRAPASPSPPPPQPLTPTKPPPAGEKWVFGGPIEMERIYTGGRGDVEFTDELGADGLAEAMGEGMRFEHRIETAQGEEWEFA